MVYCFGFGGHFLVRLEVWMFRFIVIALNHNLPNQSAAQRNPKLKTLNPKP